MAALSPSCIPPQHHHHCHPPRASGENCILQVTPSAQPQLLSLAPNGLSFCRQQPTTSLSKLRRKNAFVVATTDHTHPLKVMIFGAPASGKGTQCELITKKHNLVHISAGDLLRAEVAAGTENGKKAKEHMNKGELVPNEIVVDMVKNRLNQPDVESCGWLLDGYPRSLSQALAIEAIGIRPDVFILLDVPEEVLIDRVVGRRLDPETGKIYHIKFLPPENEEITMRLIQRFDDTEHQARLRLQTHSQNVEDVLSGYKDVIRKVDGNRPIEVVFQEIDELLSALKS